MHETLRERLKSQKRSDLRSMLINHLQQIMPRNKTQHTLFPKLQIQFPENEKFTLETRVRKNTDKHYQLRKQRCPLETLTKQIREFRQICDQAT